MNTDIRINILDINLFYLHFEQKIYFCVNWLFARVSEYIIENIFALIEV